MHNSKYASQVDLVKNKNFNCSVILVCIKKKKSCKLLGQLNFVSTKKHGGF